MNSEEKQALLKTLGEQAGSAGATKRLRGLVTAVPAAQAALEAAKANERNLKGQVDLAEAMVVVAGVEGKNAEERAAALIIAKHEDKAYQSGLDTWRHAQGSVIHHEEQLGLLSREWSALRLATELFIALVRFYGAGE